jgi:xylulokinase
LYYLGYDIGSSSIKVAIVDVNSGKSLSTIYEPSNEMEIVSTHPDWAEQDPELWWNYVCIGTKRIIQETKIDADGFIGTGG